MSRRCFGVLILVAAFSRALGEEKYVPFPVIFVHGIASEGSRWDGTKRELERLFRKKYDYPDLDARALNPQPPPAPDRIRSDGQALPRTPDFTEEQIKHYFPFMDYEDASASFPPNIQTEFENIKDQFSPPLSPDDSNNGDIRTIAFFHLRRALQAGMNAYAKVRFGLPVFRSDGSRPTPAPSDLLDDEKLKEVKLNLVCHSMGGLVLRSLLKQEADGKFAPLPNDFYTSHIHRVVFIGTPHLGSPLASFSEREARG